MKSELTYPSKFVIIMLILTVNLPFPSVLEADTYINVSGKIKATGQNIGQAENFLVVDSQIPIFIAPYTIYFNFFPEGDSIYDVDIELHELGPGFSLDTWHMKIETGIEYSFDAMSYDDIVYEYDFTITKDTTEYMNLLPIDSLVPFESTHYKLYVLRSSLADYYYYARLNYLETIFDRYRKELSLTRPGKIDFYVMPGSNNSHLVDNLKGYTIDVAGSRIYGVFNQNFETILPEITQQLVIYENWGFSIRSNVVGFSRYFLGDIYELKKYIDTLGKQKITDIISGVETEEDDIFEQVSGAFVFFLIDRYGFADFQNYYRNSRTTKPAVNIYRESLNSIADKFIAYIKSIKLTESEAAYFSELFSNQLWFEKSIPYLEWLANQNILKDDHTKKLGINTFYIGDYARSKSVFETLASRNPDDPEAQYMLSQAILRADGVTAAVPLMQKVKSKIPAAALKLAEIHLDNKEYESARAILDELPVFDSFSAFLKARLAFFDGNKPKADSLAEMLYSGGNQKIELAPAEANGYIDAGNALMLNGLYSDAEIEFRIALFIEKRPYYRGLAYLGSGRLYDLQGDRGKALENYELLSKCNPGEYLKSLAKKYQKAPFSLK